MVEDILDFLMLMIYFGPVMIIVGPLPFVKWRTRLVRYLVSAFSVFTIMASIVAIWIILYG